MRSETTTAAPGPRMAARVVLERVAEVERAWGPRVGQEVAETPDRRALAEDGGLERRAAEPGETRRRRRPRARCRRARASARGPPRASPRSPARPSTRSRRAAGGTTTSRSAVKRRTRSVSSRPSAFQSRWRRSSPGAYGAVRLDLDAGRLRAAGEAALARAGRPCPPRRAARARRSGRARAGSARRSARRHAGRRRVQARARRAPASTRSTIAPSRPRPRSRRRSSAPGDGGARRARRASTSSSATCGRPSSSAMHLGAEQQRLAAARARAVGDAAADAVVGGRCAGAVRRTSAAT